MKKYFKNQLISSNKFLTYWLLSLHGFVTLRYQMTYKSQNTPGEATRYM